MNTPNIPLTQLLDQFVRLVSEEHPAVRNGSFLLLRIATLSPSVLLTGEVNLNEFAYKGKMVWLYNPVIFEEEILIDTTAGTQSRRTTAKPYPGLEFNTMWMDLFAYNAYGILAEPFRGMYRREAESFYGVKVTPNS